jgi:hypothetical protein
MINGARFEMGIELVIERSIPLGPVGQALKIAPGELREATLLGCHFLSL